MKYTALLGHPVEHSISPVLFAELVKNLSIEYAHIKIDVNPKSKLRQAIKSLQLLNFSGANITLPYKLEVIKFCSKLDKTAIESGAVNTLAFIKNQIIGYNTDNIGAFLSIENKLKKIGKKDRILVIGAGGAARAIIAGVYKKTDNIIILNRTLSNAKRVSDFLSEKNKKRIEFYKLNNSNLLKEIIKANYIVQATPVGMYPNNKDEIIPSDIYNKAVRDSNFNEKYFFDAIFNPYETKFLYNAKKHGANICSGTYMMIYQALSAIKIWLNLSDKLEVDVDKINQELIRALDKY